MLTLSANLELCRPRLLVNGVDTIYVLAFLPGQMANTAYAPSHTHW